MDGAAISDISTVGHGLLGQVVVDDECVAAGMLGIRGVAVGVVVHEVLTNGSAGHRRDVLHRSGIRSRGGDDDRLVENAVGLQRTLDSSDRGGLLADGNVDADHVSLGLVDDGVDGDSRLARLAVANDELTLATSDGDHGVDGEQARLDGLADRLALHDARGLELDGATGRRVDGTAAVDGLAERVHNAAEHGRANGDVH